MLTTVPALIMACAILFVLELSQFKRSLTHELISMADLTGANSAAALEFDDARAGEQTLHALIADPRVTSAALYNESGQIFATLRNPPSSSDVIPVRPGAGVSNERLHITVFRPVVIANRQIGTVYVRATTSEIYDRLREYALSAGVVLLITSLAAFLLSSGLRKVVSEPILNLTDTVKRVYTTNDYSLRASKLSNDETGVLVDHFNEMLEQIRLQNNALKQREDELKSLNEELEERVIARTRELEESQERLRHSERLASIGTLAAGVAHEIRNPLNSILLASQYLLRYKPGLDEMVAKGLNSISSEAQRCGKIIKSILLFAKSEKTIKTTHDLNAVIRDAVELGKSYVQQYPSLSIDLKLASALPPVMINQTEIEQVLLNLISNAAEAASGNVRVEIITDRVGDSVRFIVRDNGPGMSTEVVKRVFDPFFSTKRQQGNTGLGLSLSHGIVSEHGGTMTVESLPGKGTTFTINLPQSAVHG